ncbi:uncharacterized protein LOC130549453 isoform X3 [Triplophysa rosa]|uniref:uncharacterized protein LOC130549453 isoform X3 n=1 Tax=Triplophysa rosa TaxID=992332 RepID=UPI0025460E59|nr:uncharacterized protein LOC130549453 isoform X3 [Triplophysa rosa]
MQAAGQISVKQLVRLLPVEIPACICDCSNGTVLVSSARPMILITMNGRYNLTMPHLSCAVCGYSRGPSLSELQTSGYWPGNIPASTLYNTDVLVSFREMKMASPGMSYQAFVKMLDEKTKLFGRSGKISANVFSCSFNEWVAARYEVEKMCQEEFFTCPACTPDMLAVSVDGNRKHYRFKNTASTEKRGLFDQLFIQSDVEVSGFVDFIHKNNNHVSGRGLCGASHWTAAKESSKKSSSKLDEEGLEIAVKYGGAYQEGAGSTIGEEVEQVVQT